MSKLVVFDCDDVLADFRTHLAAAVTHVAKCESDWREWDTFKTFYEKHNISKNEVLQTIIDWETLKHLTPEPCATLVTKMCRDAGYKIVVLTARGFYPNATEVTKQWLTACNVMFDDVIVVDHQVSKADVLAEMGDILFYVDDNSDHIIHSSMLPNIEHVIVKNMPWNASLSYEKRINDLSELVNYLP